MLLKRGILSVNCEKGEKSAKKLAEIGYPAAFNSSLYSLNITFGAPPPPKSLKSTPKNQMGKLMYHDKKEPGRPDRSVLESLYWGRRLSLPKLGRLFGVHRGTVSRWMRDYDIERRSFNKLWTEKEIFTLRKFYPSLKKIEMILPLLPGRTLESIYKKAQELGIRWIPRKKPSRKKLEKLYKTLGTKRAAKYLDISPTHFRRWTKSMNVKLKSPIKKPDLTPSAELVYILGVLKGDGYVYKRGRAQVIGLETISENFVKSFANVLRKIGLVPSKRTRWVKGSLVYGVSAISKNFVEWYKNLDLAQIKELIGKNKEFAAAFVRGFYESEGSYGISKGYPSISICNTNLPLLLLIKELVSSLGYDLNLNKPRKTSTGKSFYRLRKCGKGIPELITIIKPCIKAKPSNATRGFYRRMA